MASPAPSSHRTTLVVVAVVSVILWAIPGVRAFMLPLTYLNTHIHELCHALAALGTGGSVDHIRVFADGSGVTPVRGGSLFLLASAGYVGSAVIGALLILFSRTGTAARTVFWTLGATLGISLLLFVRGDWVGVASGIVWCLGCGLLAMRGKSDLLVILAQFLGVQQCITSFQSILVLVNLAAATEAQSDAKIMEQATRIPALFWAVVWSLMSTVLVFLTLRRAWHAPAPSDSSFT